MEKSLIVWYFRYITVSTQRKTSLAKHLSMQTHQYSVYF